MNSAKFFSCRLNKRGSIAVGNLIVVALCLLTDYALFPDVIVRVDVEPRWKLLVGRGIAVALTTLTFPVGWLSQPSGTNMLPIYAPLFVPLNAYLWGLLGEYLCEVRRRRIRGTP